MAKRIDSKKLLNSEESKNFILDQSLGIERIRELIRRLRDDKEGCPWDREQSNKSLIKYTIEEAYEVAESIEQNSAEGLCDELGDLLFNIVFHSEIAAEEKKFTFHDVVNCVISKMVSRHPHVFGGTKLYSVDEVTLQWEEIKRKERKIECENQLLAEFKNIPKNLPALTQASKIQKKASKVNFDWDSEAQIVEKILEEIEEYSQAVREENEFAKLEEFGDILFSVVNLGRFSGLDPETALRFANEKFIQRVVKIDKSLKNDGSSVLETDRKQLNKLWEKIKKTDKDFDQ